VVHLCSFRLCGARSLVGYIDHDAKG